MTSDQIDRMVRQANPVPDPTVLEAVDVSALMFHEQRRTEVQLMMADQGEEKPQPGLLIGIAAGAIVLAGVLVVFVTRHDAPVADQQPPSPVEIATAFVEAYAASDIETAISYVNWSARWDPRGVLGDGSVARGASARTDTDVETELSINRRFLAAIGFQLILDSCEKRGKDDASTTVRCRYDFHALGSEESGLGPFSGNYFDLRIQAGAIVSVAEHLENMSNGFSSQMWEPFGAWVTETHPEDAAIMYADWPNQSIHALTDESLSLWEQRSREYSGTVSSSTYG
ncbi:MAG TPA: hypothetical protein VLA54_08640 [Acidimicrobiia bacterium]|nr:hypothetical protein [Acidimicrobiia bacterium]